MFFINGLTYIAHKIIIFVYEREEPMSRKPATIATNAVNVMHGKISMRFQPPVTS